MEKKSKPWRLTLYLAYMLTALLVLITIFAILLRVGISRLEDNPEWIKSWLSSQLNADVTFNDLEIGSIGNTIFLGIKDLDVQVKQTKVSLVRAAEIEIKINWLQSALNFGLETSAIKFKSPYVSLIHHIDGHFSIGNLDSFKNNKDDSFLTHWILKQKRITMSNLEMHFHSMRFKKDWQIKQASLVIVPVGKKRNMEIHSGFANQGWLRVQSQWSGDLAKSRGWQGYAHINGKNLPADLLMSFAPNESINLYQSLVDINSQFKWQKGQIQSGFGKLSLQQTLLTNSRNNSALFKALFIPKINVAFQMQSEGKMTKTSLNINLPKQKNLPEQNLRLYGVIDDTKINIASSSIKPGLIKYFSKLYPDQIQRTLDKLNLQVKISHLQAVIPLNKKQAFKSQIRFSDLKFNSVNNAPGLDSINGTLHIENKNYHLSYNSDNLVLNFPTDFFRKPLKIGKSTGAFTLSLLENQQWALSSEKIKGKTAVANLGVAFKIKSIPDKKRPFIELVGDFNASTPKTVPDYLPIKIMKPKLIKWLDNAFSIGTVTDGSVLIHGNLNKYPFVDKKNGSQLISMNVNNGELFYQPGWPKIKNISTNVAFDEIGITCSVKSARSSGVKIGSGLVSIANFKGLPEPRVKLKLTSQSNLPALQKFLNQTPLKKTFAKVLSKLSISGNSKLKIDIDIPLKKTGNKSKIIPKVYGSLELSNNKLKVLPLDLTLSRLNGKINFTQNSIKSSSIKGTMLGGNFNGKIITTTGFDKKNGLIKISGAGNFTSDKINAWAKFLTPDINGKANWNAQLQFAKNGKHQAKISSNMRGTTVFMPNIINKSKAKTLDTKLNINWNKDNLSIAFNAGNVAKGLLRKYKAGIWSGGIRLPKGKVKTYKTGILISGNLPFINFNSWDKWLSSKANSGKITKKSKQKIFATVFINKLQMGQTNLKKANINANYYQGKWQSSFKTSTFAGKITVPPKSATTHIVLDWYVLNTKAMSNKTSGKTDMPKSKVLLDIKSLLLNNKNLGRLKVNLIPTASGATISNLSLRSAAFNLTGAGRWYKKSNSSVLNVNIAAKRLQSLLWAFGYHGKIKNAATNISLAANWYGSPLNFSMSRLNGNGKLNISNGDFIDIDTRSSAKSLVSLLKLNLTRINKNSLDFRNIIGNYSIKKGVLNTKKIKLNSVAANIEFKGNTSLARQTFDMRATITPKLGGALPLIGAATAGVPGLVAGGVVAVIDKVSGNGISKAARKKLRISGSWTNPIVKKLGRTRQKSDNTNNTDLLGIPIYD